MRVLLVFCILFLAFSVSCQEEQMMQIKLETSAGDITIELFSEEAPITVENFVQYVNDGFFDGTIFHRVIPGFVIQGGGFTPDMVQKNTRPPIENEATNGLTNDRGTLSMARTNVIHSATSQFFINLQDNDFLNNRDTSTAGYGYAVFGKVVSGLEIVDAIAQTTTVSRAGHQDVPETPIVINKASVVK